MLLHDVGGVENLRIRNANLCDTRDHLAAWLTKNICPMVFALAKIAAHNVILVSFGSFHAVSQRPLDCADLSHVTGISQC
jgi:hypothetical protein